MTTITGLVRTLEAWRHGSPTLRGSTLKHVVVESSSQLHLSFITAGGDRRLWAVGWQLGNGDRRLCTVIDPFAGETLIPLLTELSHVLRRHLTAIQTGSSEMTQIWFPGSSHVEQLQLLAIELLDNGNSSWPSEILSSGADLLFAFTESRVPGQQFVVDAAACLNSAFEFPVEDSRKGHLGCQLRLLQRRHLEHGSFGPDDLGRLEIEQRSFGTLLHPADERTRLWPAMEAFRSGEDLSSSGAAIVAVLEDELNFRLDASIAAAEIMLKDSRPPSAACRGDVTASVVRFHRHLDAFMGDNSFSKNPRTDSRAASAAHRYFSLLAREGEQFLRVHDDAEAVIEAVEVGDVLRGMVVEHTGLDMDLEYGVLVLAVPATWPLRMREGESVVRVGDIEVAATILRIVPQPEFERSIVVIEGISAPLGSVIDLVGTSYAGISENKARLAGNRFHDDRDWLLKVDPPIMRRSDQSMDHQGLSLSEIASETEEAITKSLGALRESGAVVVKAPPGAGKTTLLIKLAREISKGRSVAVACFTNAQADDIVIRMVTLDPNFPVIRFVSVIAESTTTVDPRYVESAPSGIPPGHVVVAGVQKWTASPRLNIEFDYVFVDEAWQITWADLLGLRRLSSRYLLIGDPGQIPPVVPIDTKWWATCPQPPDRPAPEVLLETKHDVAIHQLPGSRRLPQSTVEVVRHFYDFDFNSYEVPGDRWISSEEWLGENADVLCQLESSSIVWCPVPTPVDGPPHPIDDEVAHRAAQLVLDLLSSEPRIAVPGGERSWVLGPNDVGIVASHRVMNSRILHHLGSEGRGVRVDTAERWQGLERPIMVAVHPLSSTTSPQVFDLDSGRLCVMLSRHQVAMIVIGRDHIAETLERTRALPEQALGLPDVVGRGLTQHQRAMSAVMGQKHTQ